MPKMSDGYLTEKRNQILNAAFAVCMKKPIYEVSMRDIISEVGFSQGNIYRYFSNIDEILIALLNRESVAIKVEALVDSAILSDDVPEKVIGELFGVWEKAILDNLIGVGKIYYELSNAYANDKERQANFLSKTRITSEEAYLQEKSLLFIMHKITDGYFNPKIEVEDIFAFLITSFSGIIRDLILSNHYQIGGLPFGSELKKDRLIKSLCTAFVMLLGGDENLIYQERIDSD